MLGQKRGNRLVKPVTKECCPAKFGSLTCKFFVVNTPALSGDTLTLSTPFPSAKLDKTSSSTNIWKFGNENIQLHIVNLLGTGKMYGSMHKNMTINGDTVEGETFYHILPCGKGLNVLRKTKKNVFPIDWIPKK